MRNFVANPTNDATLDQFARNFDPDVLREHAGSASRAASREPDEFSAQLQRAAAHMFCVASIRARYYFKTVNGKWVNKDNCELWR